MDFHASTLSKGLRQRANRPLLPYRLVTKGMVGLLHKTKLGMGRRQNTNLIGRAEVAREMWEIHVLLTCCDDGSRSPQQKAGRRSDRSQVFSSCYLTPTGVASVRPGSKSSGLRGGSLSPVHCGLASSMADPRWHPGSSGRPALELDGGYVVRTAMSDWSCQSDNYCKSSPVDTHAYPLASQA
jgi:hypothetical protein